MSYTPTQIALAKLGDPFVFDFAHADVAQTFTFDSSGWGLYQANGVAVGETISPNLNSDGTGQAGTFTASVTLFHLSAYDSAHIVWDGTGFTVSYSLDNGTTWTDISEYATVPLTPASDPDLDIKVTFAAGGAGDSALNSLTVYVLTSGATTTSSGSSTMTFGVAPISDTGLTLTAGATVETDSTAEPIASVEMIATVDSLASVGTLLDTPDSGTTGPWAGYDTTGVLGFGNATVYVNGVVASSAPNLVASSVPYHFLIVFTTPVNEEILIGISRSNNNQADITLSHLAFYRDTLTDTDALNLYTSNVEGLPTIVVNDTATITVTESSPATDVYAYAWSVVSGGTS